MVMVMVMVMLMLMLSRRARACLLVLATAVVHFESVFSFCDSSIHKKEQKKRQNKLHLLKKYLK